MSIKIPPLTSKTCLMKFIFCPQIQNSSNMDSTTITRQEVSLSSLILRNSSLKKKKTQKEVTNGSSFSSQIMSSTQATLFCLLFIATLITASTTTSPTEKLTHLHFYFHEVDSGPNATVVTSATLHRNSTFGDVNLFDNTLRVGPQPDSTLIGGAQGIGVHAALDGSQGLTAINFFFTAGEYNGSSLATLGVIKASGPSDRSIVGGTGKFRFARGYMLSKLVNSTAASLVVEFDMYIIHI